jgi:hypothetical protein
VSGSGGGILEEEWRRGRLVPQGESWRGSRSQRGRIALRLPQVVVRITGKSRGAAKVWGRLWYISHEGELALEREDGTTVEGQAELRQLLEQWSVHFDQRRNGRDTVQLSFSVPESEVEATPGGRDRVLDAVRETARAEWGASHPFVLGSHTNSSNFHVHVIVRSRGYQGEPLPCQKADLERWRDRFAGACRERELWVDASPRAARGHTRRSVSTPVHRKLERGETLREDGFPSLSDARAWETAVRNRSAGERVAYAREAVSALRAAQEMRDPQARARTVELATELGRYAVEMPFEAPRSAQMRAPFQRAERLEGAAVIESVVRALPGEGSAAVRSDLHGWVSVEEAAAESQRWGDHAEQVLFVVHRREYVSPRDQGRSAVGFATAALASVGAQEYALRAEVGADLVRVYGVVGDPSGRLAASLERVERAFVHSAEQHGYAVERFEDRPGLQDVKAVLSELAPLARAVLASLPAESRRERAAELEGVLARVPGLEHELDVELELDEELEP